ncbi:MAG: NAD(P)H-hydrate epimerase, partial [Alphaproteobacteria bacterium]
MIAGLEILTVAETAAADAAAIARGTSGVTLMERAGGAVARAICERWTPRPTAVLCGPGNNGGDGYVVARWLKRRGWPVWVERAGPPQTADAQRKALRWRGRTLDLAAADGEAELVVDALFGAGLSRPLSGTAEFRARAADARKVIAIDVPSGIAGDTGQMLGKEA